MGEIIEKSELELITEEILQLKRNMTENTIVLGIKLKQVKESLGHGSFGEYLETQVDFTSRTAQKFIKIAEEFSNTKATSFLGLSSEKLYLLTTIPKDSREEFVAGNDIENMSTRELQQAIKNSKKPSITTVETLETEGNINTLVEIERVTEPLKPQLADDIIWDEIDDIWNNTCLLQKEIELRTGWFYNDINSNLVLTDYESLLIIRYEAGEVSYQQLKQVLERNKLNIPFVNNEPMFQKFINSLEISNSYSHSEYIDGGYSTYYDVVESKELSYENVVECAWVNDANYSQKDREDIKAGALETTFTKDSFTVSKGYIETTSYICLYIDKKLIAQYDLDKDYMMMVKKLFKFKELNKKYYTLVEKFDEKEEIIRQQKYTVNHAYLDK